MEWGEEDRLMAQLFVIFFLIWISAYQHASRAGLAARRHFAVLSLAGKIFKTALVWHDSFCYMLRRRQRFGTYHDAVVAELVDAQR
jgi:hypothetical protein